MGGVGIVKSAVSGILSKLDEKQQKKEYYNLSTFGNIEELNRVASDTASLVTLYYKEQIQSIDTGSKIKGSNVFNDKTKWIKDVLIDVRPEEKEEMPVVIVAEYITGSIVEALKEGQKNFKTTEPLPQQLWFRVAQKNFVEQGKLTAIGDVLGATAGRQKIPLKRKQQNGQETTVHVQLRHLIGCVSVVTKDSKIYQYAVSKESRDEELTDLELFGYVYVTPFLNDDESLESIIQGRNLNLAPKDDCNNILTKFDDIVQHVESFQVRGDQDRQLAITAETARQVAQVLRDEKYFVNPTDLEGMLDQSRQKIECDIAALSDRILEKADYYQTSIDATSEKLQKDVADAREALAKDNDKHYTEALQNINEQLKQIEKNLENQIMQRMNTIETELKLRCDEMQKIIQAAKTESNQAFTQATIAVETSQQAVQHSQQAAEQATKSVQLTEQQQQDFQTVMEKCELIVKQTIVEQKNLCEQTVSSIRAKVQQDFERMKQSCDQATAAAKESAQSAKELAKSAQETQKDNKRQLDLQKEETNKVISEAKEITKQNERSANEAKEANKQARQGADATSTALAKVDSMYEKMEKALERLEKLAKRLDAK